MRKLFIVLLLLCLAIPSFGLTKPSFHNIKDKPFASVVEYGAISDDNIDDTAAFLSAMQNNVWVYVPVGTFNIASLTVPASCRKLSGLGEFSYVMVATGSTGLIITNNMIVEEISLIGPDGSTAIPQGRGTTVNQAFVDFKNVNFQDLDVGMEYLKNNSESNWIGCTWRHCAVGIRGINGGGVNNKFQNCRLWDCTRAVELLDTGTTSLDTTEGVTFSECSILRCGVGSSGGAAFYASGTRYLFLRGTMVDISEGYALLLSNCEDTQIVGGYYVSSHPIGYQASNLFTGNFSRTSIIGTQFSWGYTGLMLDGLGQTCEDVKVIGCNFDDNVNRDMLVQDITSITLTDNSFTSAASPSLVFLQYLLAPGSPTVKLVNNNISNGLEMSGIHTIDGLLNTGFTTDKTGVAVIGAGATTTSILHELQWQTYRTPVVWTQNLTNYEPILSSISTSTITFNVSTPASVGINILYRAEILPE